MIDVRITKKRSGTSSGFKASGGGGAAASSPDTTELVMSWIRSWLVPVDSDGNELDRDSAESIAALKAKYPFFSVGEVSAYGFEEGTASGGGVGINASELAQYLSQNGYATQNWVEGKKYLTEHQSLADYLKKTDAASTYQPKGSYALASDLTAHTGNSTVHITSAERSSWNGKLDKSAFDELFAKETVNGKTVIKAKFSLYSADELSAYGFEEGTASGGGVGINASELAQYLSQNGYATKDWVQARGYLTDHQDLSSYARKSEIPSLTGYATESWVLGKKYLTEHQSLADYLKKTDASSTYLSKTDAASTYQPKGNYALASDLTAHTGNSTVHITSAERSSWNGKLDKSDFDELFAKETVNGKTVIKAKFSLYSADELSAYGFEEGTASGGGVGINASELAQYLSQNGYATKDWVLGKKYLTDHQSLANYMGFKREVVDPDTITNICVREVNASTNAPTTNGWHQYMSWGTADSGYVFQFANKYSEEGDLYFRQKTKNVWKPWKTVLTNTNYTSHVATLRDRTNGTATYLNYGAAGISNPSWLAAWNGYELRAISPANVLSCIGALPLTGGTLTGALNFTYNTWNVVGDDVAIGDCNAAGQLGIKGLNANPGFAFFDKDGNDKGRLTSNGNLLWNGNTLWHSGNDGSGSGLDADLLDGLHASDYARASSAMWNNSETVADWSKRISSNVGILSTNGWAWANSANLVIGSYSIDRQRYSAIDFRTGYLNNTWQQKAYLFLPAYTDQSMIYIAQMTTSDKAGVVSTSVKRYADYDTILNSNVASASKLANTRTIWGQNFNGEGNVSGNMTGVGNINTAAAPAGTVYMNNWFRSIGSTGWYSETYGGGWYMSDDTWIRTYGSKSIYHNAGILRTDGTFQVGGDGGRFLVRADGNVGVGTTAPTCRLHVAGDTWCNTLLAGYGVRIFKNGSTSGDGFCIDNNVNLNFSYLKDNVFQKILFSVSTAGNVTVNGSLCATGELTALTTSDLRLKGNVRPVEDPLRMLRALGGYRMFDYLPEAGVEDRREHVGLIYQDVSGLTGERMRRLRPDGFGALNYMHPDYINLIGAGVIQLDDEMARLKRRVRRLEEALPA